MPRQGSSGCCCQAVASQSPCRASLLSSSHNSWHSQVAADDRIFTRGNHDGISVYPLQQVDKSQQMGFPSELESAGLFLPSHKYLSSTRWKCQAHPVPGAASRQRLLPPSTNLGAGWHWRQRCEMKGGLGSY